jgi:hypothetical protein
MKKFGFAGIASIVATGFVPQVDTTVQQSR